MTIEQLDLVPEVSEKARELLRRHPGVRFISGRRTVAEQSVAMASNVIHNRAYIRETYAHTAIAARLCEWVEGHPGARSITAIAAGLAAVLSAAPPAELIHLSRHFGGRAFDVQPGSCPEAAIHALAPELFLTHEGGLTRWHVQF